MRVVLLLTHAIALPASMCGCVFECSSCRLLSRVHLGLFCCFRAVVCSSRKSDRVQEELAKLDVLLSRRGGHVSRIRAALKKMAWLESAGVGLRTGKSD